ncbi:MAG: glycogen/starch synthase [Candidatus Woesearchaeota archaeon]
MDLAKAKHCFEVSWEVCNKVGGISTVLTSKASQMREAYKHYILIGPYFKDKAELEIMHAQEPDFIKSAFAELSNYGIQCYYGTWQIKGEPPVILIDFQKYRQHTDEIKKQMWDNFQVDSLQGGSDYDEPLVWAFCAGLLLDSLTKKLDGPSVVQAHEWLSGAAILHLKAQNNPAGTVFTTHATMLGRALAGSGAALYDDLAKYDPMWEAGTHGVMAKHTMEKAAAQNADVFTTVSEITGLEAEHLLGRKPDVLLPNGLDMDKFPTIEETSLKHVQARAKIREFLTYQFFPYYTFDMEHTLHFFILGRYEYHNKGIDVLLRSLSLLNNRLKNEKSDRTIAVFFFIMRPHKGIKLELYENKNHYRHIKGFVESNSQEILRRLVYDFVSGATDPPSSIFTKDFLRAINRDIHTFKREGNPLVCTHNLENEYQDDIVKNCYSSGLDNKEDDKVKVIFYPTMLDGSDGLIDLPLYDAIAGCHLGLFPSYYEPWGYTPLEGAAMGVPSVTTDLSGFGKFIEPYVDKERGIYVLKMHGVPFEETANKFAELMYNFAAKDHSERVELKIAAKTLSQLCDWQHFIKFYVKAHNMAVEKHN